MNQHRTLLLHGGPGLKRDYLHRHLKDRFAGLVSFDYPGCGDDRSREPVTLDETLARIDEEVSLLSSFDVIAHSFGAFLLMELFRRNPSWTSGKIALVCPFPTSGTGFEKCAALIGQKIREKLSAADIARREALTPDYGGPSDLLNVQLIEPIYVHDKSFASQLNFGYDNPLLRAGIYDSIGDFDHREVAKPMKNPVLLVLGAQDFIQPDQIDPWPVRAAKVEVIEDVGHSPFIEKPEFFFRALNDFFA